MAHYAITELFIVLAALYGGRQLLAHELHFAALGFLIFGAAAFIGVIRFPSGQIEQLAGLHRLAGTLGGLIAMQALTHQMLSDTKWECVHLIIAGLAIGICLFLPVFRVAFFLLWSLAFIWRIGFHTPQIQLKSFIKTSIAALMLFNVIIIRQSPFIAPDVSWHIFHTLIAIWIMGLTRLLVHPFRV